MALRGVELLLGEIEKAKGSLEDIDKSIAKLTGRNPNEPAPRQGQRRFSAYGAEVGEENSGDQSRPFGKTRRGFGGDEGSAKRRASETSGGRHGISGDGPPAKRRTTGGAFSRLGPMVGSSRLGPRDDVNSGDEEELSKHTVHSSVVANPVSRKSREEVLELNNKDQESKDRNKRMFGVLMGTLQRFKKEEKQLSEKEAKRKAVEQKLEMKARQELENIKKERRKLFLVKQRKEQKIRRLEQKVELVKIHEEWAAQTKMLGNFIRTKARPHLYYAPKTHTSGSTAKLKGTKEFLEKIIKDRRKQLEEEIEMLMREEEDEPQKESKEPEEAGNKQYSVEHGKGVQNDKKKGSKHDNNDGNEETMHAEESSKGNKENELSPVKDDEHGDVGKNSSGKERDPKLTGLREKPDQERVESKSVELRKSSSSSRQSRSHRANESDKGRSEKHSSSRHRRRSHQDAKGDGAADEGQQRSVSDGESRPSKMDDKPEGNADPKDDDNEQSDLNDKGLKEGGDGEIAESKLVSEEGMDVNNVEEENGSESEAK